LQWKQALESAAFRSRWSDRKGDVILRCWCPAAIETPLLWKIASTCGAAPSRSEAKAGALRRRG
jgi:hypothetical protein